MLHARLGIIGVLGGIFVLASSAGAATTTVTCGQVITTDTHVANDLRDCPGDGLVIGSPGIVLDIGGHTIDGTGNGAGVRNQGHSNVTVEHGRVQQFGTGVLFDGQDGGTIDRIVAVDNVDGLAVLDSTGTLVDRSTGSDNDSQGLVATNAPGIVVDRGEYHGNGFSGPNIFANDDSAVVRRTRANGNGIVGIAVQFGSDDVLLEDVVASGNGVAQTNNCNCGIFAGNGVTGIRVVRTVTKDNRWLGVWFAGSTTGGTIAKSHSSSNGFDGVLVDSAGNRLAGNHANFNGDYGIEAAPGTIDGGQNKAHHNGNPQQCTGVSC
jgi:hypothetical protein